MVSAFFGIGFGFCVLLMRIGATGIAVGEGPGRPEQSCRGVPTLFAGAKVVAVVAVVIVVQLEVASVMSTVPGLLSKWPLVGVYV